MIRQQWLRLLFAAANRKDFCRDANRGHRGRIMLR